MKFYSDIYILQNHASKNKKKTLKLAFIMYVVMAPFIFYRFQWGTYRGFFWGIEYPTKEREVSVGK